MEIGGWAGSLPGVGVGRDPPGSEPFLLFLQRPLLASEGTCTQEPVLGGPVARLPWCSLWARPPAGPRHRRVPVPGCSQVRTARCCSRWQGISGSAGQKAEVGGSVGLTRGAGLVPTTPAPAAALGGLSLWVRGPGLGPRHAHSSCLRTGGPTCCGPGGRKDRASTAGSARGRSRSGDLGVQSRWEGVCVGELRGVCPESAARGPLPAVGSSSSLGSAGSSSARHLPPGACGEAASDAPAPGHCCGFADPVTANLEGAVTFEAPDLPEETLMEVRAPRRG